MSVLSPGRTIIPRTMLASIICDGRRASIEFEDRDLEQGTPYGFQRTALADLSESGIGLGLRWSR